jgi:hypothetical protein
MTRMRAASRLLAAGALGGALTCGSQSASAQDSATQQRAEVAPKKLQATPKQRPKAVPERKSKPTAKPRAQAWRLSSGQPQNTCLQVFQVLRPQDPA